MSRRPPRHGWLLVILSTCLGLITLRLGWMQVVDVPVWSRMAENSWVAEHDLPARRGTILDRNGRVLAQTVTAFNIVLHTRPGNFPKVPVFTDEAAVKLAPLVHMTPDEIRKAAAGGGEWAELRPGGLRIDEDTAQKIRELQLPGVFLTETTKRVYPSGTAAAHVVGFVNAETGQGQAGVELQFNDVLSGQPGHARYLKDPEGTPLPFGEQQIKPAVDGKNVVLTIDGTIQSIVERELDRLVAETRPKSATAIVADPHTGEILAMANRPTYDPNAYWTSTSAVLDRNIAISDPFEPGSTFKIVTLVAALAEHKIRLDETFSSGQIVVQGIPIHDWNYQGFGTITFKKAVAVSSNVGFVIMGQRLGAEKLYQYIYQFGFNSRTGIDLPGESGAQLFDPAVIRPIDLATTSFGQGIAVTPIQQVAAVMAVANGGKLVRPHVLKEIVDPQTGQVVQQTGVQVIRDRVAPPEVLSTVRQVLEDDVREDKAKAAYLPGYHVAGKTGTAQIPRPDHRGYYSDRYRTSFIGFAPANDPKVVVYVTAEAPQGVVQFGNTVASPVAKRILEQVLPYLQVAPDASDMPKEPAKPEAGQSSQDRPATVPAVEGHDSGTAVEEIRSAGLRGQVTGKPGPVRRQWPAAGVSSPKGGPVVLLTPPRDDGKIVVPDLRGLSMRDVADLCAVLGLQLRSSGDGWAVDQDVRPGQLVPPGSVLHVKFGGESPVP
ncbi:MAG: penicillin-binding transpeptidase domain-containing protein [Alicyclobacillaceae bacterium]|nr:penicillin-binding transpeptidase domain-containing protein [Alicyclobacillaceae bacterium]